VREKLQGTFVKRASLHTLQRLVWFLAVALAAGCRLERQSVRIEQFPGGAPLSVAIPNGWRVAYGDLLTTALPDQVQLMEAGTSAEAVGAVAAGRTRLALARMRDATGLTAEPFAAVALSLLVPLTFPIEDVDLDQARALTAGQIGDWRFLGGPGVPVRPVIWGTDDDAASAAALLGLSPVAPVTTPAERVTAGGLVLYLGEPPSPALKALRVDGRLPNEDGYPLVERRVVVGRAEDLPAVRAVAGLLRSQEERRQAPRVVLDAVGDVMLGRGVGQVMRERGMSYPFEAVQPLLVGSDLRFANLELPLTERGAPAAKRYTFRAPPRVADALRDGGFTLLSLANNHMLDYGYEGLLDTVIALDQAGIAHAGAGRSADEAHAPAVVTVHGLRIALLAYVNVPDDVGSGFSTRAGAAGPGTPGVAWGTTEAVRRDVAAARAQADLVIVSLHAGFEYTAAPNAVQRQLAHAAVEAGAALVVGSHPHVLQGVEFYRGVPIVYSLGNFVFDLDDDDLRQPGLPSVLSAVLRVTLDRSGVRALRFLPVQIDQRDGRPVPVHGPEARPVLERLYRLSAALEEGG
jgi:poly-gamma-glutamate synthesis protein (capsule biosynthesis protein)